MRTETPSQSAVQRTLACQHTSGQQTSQPTANGPSIAAISWGYMRQDVFGITTGDGKLSHKYYDGYQWQPGVEDLEKLGDNNLGGPPGAVAGNNSLMEYV